VALAGCSESISQYTRFGGWSRSPQKPMVLSGSPEEDSAAYRASTVALSESDWRILEKIAPRPIWERLAHLRYAFGAKGPPSPATRPTTRPAAEAAPEIRDVPTTQLAQGRVRMLYRLRHYGGSRVVSSRDGGTDRYRITRLDPDLKPLVQLVQQELGAKGSVAALPTENALVITCDEAARESVLGLLARIDSPPRQVEVRVKIFEVSHDFDFQYGAHALVEHLASDNTQKFASTFSTKAFLDSLTDTSLGEFGFQGSALRLMKVFEGAGVTLDATFQALAELGLIKVVAAPRMTVASGQSAYMLAGQELPIASAKIANDKLITEKVSYKPVGVQLYITPQVVGPDAVKLHVVTSVTAVSGFAPLPSLSGEQSAEMLVNPILDSREAETYVQVGDGSTLVIGGLRMIRTITRERKVPVLGDIALLEWLFKNHRSQNQVTDLYFFVTPAILCPGADGGRRLAGRSEASAGGE
jgi:type II secretory pathway component GspD/PulD (secretin)